MRAPVAVGTSGDLRGDGDAVGETEARLARACEKSGDAWAFTGFSAAARLAPSVRYQRVTAFVNDRVDEVLTAAGLKRVDSGANATILVPYDDGVYYGGARVGGARVVSAVQAYLDLKGFRGRGEEAAEFLLETEMRPAWRAEATTRRRR